MSERGVFCVFFTNARTTTNSSADRRDIKGASNSIAAGQAQLPQLPLKMPDVRFAQAFKSDRRDSLRKPKKPRLHVRRQGSDLRSNSFVEDIDAPGHARLYLNFEI